MSQNLREINRLKHIIEEKDREIEMLKENPEITEVVRSEPVDERLANRVNELEGMVKGLTEELLDMKAEVRKLSKLVEGASAASQPGPAAPRRTRPAIETAPAARKPAPEAASGKRSHDAVRIMQPDGTLDYEERSNDEELIVAGARPRVKNTRTGKGYRPAEESKPLIYAEEDDSVEIKKK